MEWLRPIEGIGDDSSSGDDQEAPATIQSFLASMHTIQQHAERKHEDRVAETKVESATPLGRDNARERCEAHEALPESQLGSFSGATGYIKPSAIPCGVR